MESVLALVLILVGLGIYFLPTIVAVNKSKLNTGAIFILNLLLGWTFLGWVVALVWAMTKDGGQPKKVEAGGPYDV